jgi:hypothetical protein
MKTINVKPVQIIGACPAALTLADEFQIQGLRLNNPQGSTLCFLAVSQFSIGQGIWQLQGEERFFSHVSCPGCTVALEQEKRVVFLLGHADKWELCQVISEYLRLCQGCDEPEAARRAKDEAIQHQNRGEYAEATLKMEIALRELKRSSL